MNNMSIQGEWSKLKITYKVVDCKPKHKYAGMEPFHKSVTWTFKKNDWKNINSSLQEN